MDRLTCQVLRAIQPRPAGEGGVSQGRGFIWVAVKEFKLSCYYKEAVLFTIYPYYGSLI